MSEGRYAINLKYRHKWATGGNLIDNPDAALAGRLCVLHPEMDESGEHHVTFIVGAGFLYTAPLDGVRIATPEERAEIAKGAFAQSWAGPYQIAADDPGWWDGSDPKTWIDEVPA